MKILRILPGVLALLSSAAGMAATVTITSSDPNPDVGEIFLVTISGSGFTADANPLLDQTTIGATLGITYSSNLTLVGALVNCPSSPNCTTGTVTSGDGTGSGLPATGPFSNASGGSYTPHFLPVDPTPTTPPDAGAILDTFDIITAAGATDDFVALVLAFQGTAGAATISLIDNGGSLSWFQYNDPFDVIPVTYNQLAGFNVGTPANIAVTDSVAPTGDRDVPFGAVTVGNSSTKTVTITNTGDANLTLGTLGSTNALAAPFALINDMCSGQVLGAGVPCTVDVQFSPVALGNFPDSFDIPSDDADEPSVTVTVSGDGSATAVANIVVTDSIAPAADLTVPFGTVNVGDPAATATVTVTNDGTDDLTLGALTGLAPPFSLANDNCSSQFLAPTNSCTVEVRFLPTVDGPVADVLSIPSDDPDSPTVDVAVNGTGFVVIEPDIRVEDSVAPIADGSVPFGSITVGGTSTQTVTVYNDGNGALAVGAITGLAAPFSLANDTCSNTSVAIADNCTFDVEFAPVATGPFNDAISIPSDDPDENPVAVAVSGTGLPVMAPDITVTDSVNPAADLRLPFANIEEGTTKQHTVTITNDGSDPLTLGQMGGVNALAAPFTFDADGCSNQVLDPTESCTITIGFAPPEINVYNSGFDIPSDDPDEASVIFAVSGGAQPGTRHDSPSGSALDPWTLLGLGLAGLAVKRRRRAGA